MSTTQLLAQSATSGGLTDAALIKAAAFVGGGIALAGGAIGVANGDAQVGAATINGMARQPEARGRLYGTMFLVIGLCESAYFINLAFMALFVFGLS